MLPIFRTISVGGVLLAITILALALSPPGGSHMQFTAVDARARGALIDAREHPEWRQFIIQAALRRADELNRLRELPDTPLQLPEIPFTAPDDAAVELLAAIARDASKTVGLQAGRSGAGPEDVTGSIGGASDTTIPIDIGAPSSSELPVTPEDDNPPVIRAPLTQSHEPAVAPAAKVLATEPREQIKPPAEPKTNSVQRRRARLPGKTATPAEPQSTVPIPFNLLQAFFESLARKPAAKPAVESKRAAKQKRPAVLGSLSQ